MVENRMAGLDALRGIGAALVVLFHLNWATGELGLFGRSYLAVDLFFLLSGFVLGQIYGETLGDRRLDVRSFMRGRLIRLYPMVVAGLVVGLLHWATAGMAPLNLATLALIHAWLLPLFFNTDFAFPLNNPQWSVFLEIVVNALWALNAVALRGAALALLVVASACAYLVVLALWGTGDVGANAPDLLAGLSRACLGFFGGVLLNRIWRSGHRWRPTRAGPAAFALALAGILLPAVLDVSPAIGDALVVLLVFPLVIWLAASAELGASGTRVAMALGSLSYPLYAIHFPILCMAINLIQASPHTPTESWTICAGAVALSLGLAWCLARADIHLRRRLGRWASRPAMAGPVLAEAR